MNVRASFRNGGTPAVLPVHGALSHAIALPRPSAVAGDIRAAAAAIRVPRP
ncbi:hypothetical protein [Streptosporangium lutulentum]|uniref:Uncharacterized protein n=1 Tax=Streptosporangium lutulentum TaxID=1461250 RepID=A0ABT9QPA6_9ACTN|nr:hypothetical protein [Streptosporangium lutulentum]MDP9848594.1 hypothetical protein [Streptosporangium lutulentum]